MNQRLRAANVAYPALAELKARGITMPEGINFETLGAGEEKPIAASDPRFLMLNASQEYWTDPATFARQKYIDGDWSTNDPLHVFYHEGNDLETFQRWLDWRNNEPYTASLSNPKIPVNLRMIKNSAADGAAASSLSNLPLLMLANSKANTWLAR